MKFKSGRNIRKGVCSNIHTNPIMLFSQKNTFLVSIILWKKWNSLTGFMKPEYALPSFFCLASNHSICALEPLYFFQFPQGLFIYFFQVLFIFDGHLLLRPAFLAEKG